MSRWLLSSVSLLLPALAAGGQSGVADHATLDRLQLVSLGAGVGQIAPSQVVPTRIFALTSDYGEIAPAWRVIFRISYWESRFRSSVVDAFADTLRQNLADPTATTVLRSPVSVYDAAFAIGARRILSPRAAVTPFYSGGLAAHVINAEGKLINGTFVERSLDDVAAGLFVDGGIRARFLHRIQVEGQVRGDLLSGFRSAQWVATASYFFGEPRRGENNE
jgi:hypothetical protein